MRLAWIGAVAFASGFPFGLVNEAVPIYLRTIGASLEQVADVTAITLPWTLKFLWAPLVDRVGTRRQWIAGCLAVLAALTLALATLGAGDLGPSFWLLLLLMVTVSATQDVAIDAYTIESMDTRELGVANSVRITSYRVAMFTAGGALVWLAGRTDWHASFTVGAATLAGLMFASVIMPAVGRTDATATSVWEPLRALFRRPGVWAVVVFSLLFKLDIAALEPIMRPFWVDRGLSLEEIGAVLTPGRVLATLAGAALGGLFTSRYAIFTALWVLGLVQAFSGLAYWGVAAANPSKPLLLVAALFESFAAGMGTAAFLAFLMSVCEKRFAATQFALLSALLALTRSVAAKAAGPAAEALGYAPYFLLTFFLAFPAYALLPRIRYAPLASAPPPPA
ncbi:MAG TPA: MFS transporter [Gemmatimonadales bacterium]|nr:MFS transporter [Gemmatimonadales bacterium]